MVLLKSSISDKLFCINVKSTFHYGSIKIKSYLNPLNTSYWSTFHYGSIKIVVNKVGTKLPITSTFHYGSIKISTIEIPSIEFLHLHSTMVLLKYRIYFASKALVEESTFHYGSIKIKIN